MTRREKAKPRDGLITLEGTIAAWQALSPQQRKERLREIRKQVEAAHRRRERERQIDAAEGAIAAARRKELELRKVFSDDPEVRQELHARSDELHEQGPNIELGIKVRRKNAAAAKELARSRAQSAQERRDEIEEKARAAIAQLNRNGLEPASRAALARAVAKKLGKPFNTVKGILQELGIPETRRPRRKLQ